MFKLKEGETLNIPFILKDYIYIVPYLVRLIIYFTARFNE
jgi:hypothetical protein